MRKEKKIKSLLVSILRTLADATIDTETYNTDCGILHHPIFHYMPVFEFDDDDIQLIKALGKEELEDFSTLTEI